MYVFIHVSMNVCKYVYMYVCMYVCSCIRVVVLDYIGEFAE